MYGQNHIKLEDGISTHIPLYTVSVLKQKATLCPAQIYVIVIVFLLWVSRGGMRSVMAFIGWG
jgi:hypothetical protein